MIALACDHGALELKQAIMRHLDARGLAYKDFGCYDHTSWSIGAFLISFQSGFPVIF